MNVLIRTAAILQTPPTSSLYQFCLSWVCNIGSYIFYDAIYLTCKNKGIKTTLHPKWRWNWELLFKKFQIYDWDMIKTIWLACQFLHICALWKAATNNDKAGIKTANGKHHACIVYRHKEIKKVSKFWLIFPKRMDRATAHLGGRTQCWNCPPKRL